MSELTVRLVATDKELFTGAATLVTLETLEGASASCPSTPRYGHPEGRPGADPDS